VIGALKRRVRLDRPDRTGDAGGGAAVVWTPVATVWARVASSPAGESESADDLASRVRHEVELRWRSDVRPGWRVVLGGKTLRVRAVVDPDQGRRLLVLECEEEVR
jgi:SPP1 family predicted phage head-tail adaptor